MTARMQDVASPRQLLRRLRPRVLNARNPAGFLRRGSLWGCGSDLLSLGSYGPSTIGAGELYCCVRDGNRCGLPANVTTDHWLDRRYRFEWKTMRRGMC